MMKALGLLYLIALTILPACGTTTGDDSATETLIYLVAPDVNDGYYAEVFDDIVDYQVNFVQSAGEGDRVLIVVNAQTKPYYQGQVPDEALLDGEIADIWVRDFAPLRLSGSSYKFSYAPNYLDGYSSRMIEDSFMLWHSSMGFESETIDFVLGGGNFVYDGQGQAVFTERVYLDNPSMTKDEVASFLLGLSGIEQLAIIPEEEGDITGHSDGMVFWLTPEKIAVNSFDEPFRTEIHSRLNDAFPGVEIIEIPYQPSDESWGGFPSASGIYVNALATSQNIYIPTYGLDADAEAQSIFARHTDKTIISVDASGIAMMGGSVHCLSWEITQTEVTR